MNPKLYWLSNSSRGQIAISSRPRGGDWLEDEVNGWRRQGIDVVVSLLTDSENNELDLHREGAIAKQKGLRFYSLPIEDRGVPASVDTVEAIVANVNTELNQGKKVAVHCRQAVGRSSLFAAVVLICRGQELDPSLGIIRQARGLDVPETPEQRNWLNQFAKTHTSHVAR